VIYNYPRKNLSGDYLIYQTKLFNIIRISIYIQIFFCNLIYTLIKFVINIHLSLIHIELFYAIFIKLWRRFLLYWTTTHWVTCVSMISFFFVPVYIDLQFIDAIIDVEKNRTKWIEFVMLSLIRHRNMNTEFFFSFDRWNKKKEVSLDYYLNVITVLFCTSTICTTKEKEGRKERHREKRTFLSLFLQSHNVQRQ